MFKDKIFETSKDTEIDLEIQEVYVQNQNVLIDVKRNFGEGELVRIKFTLSDGKNIETIIKDSELKESKKENFILSLTELIAEKVKSISVSPVFKSSKGNEEIGRTTDIYIEEIPSDSKDEEIIEECIPNCENLQCGLDPICGQSCGECEGTDSCINNACVSQDCIPQSDTITCGTSICGTEINNCELEVNCGSCQLGYNCENGSCQERIVIIREDYAGELYYQIDENYFKIKPTELLEKFYFIYEDNVDFLILLATKSTGHSSFRINQKVEGIGQNFGDIYPDITENLLSIINLNFYSIFKTYPDLQDSLLYGVLIHEIGHSWCCEIGGLGIDLPGHWTNNIDLLYGDTNYGDMMGYNHWVLNNGEKICVNINNVNRTFSDLTLYLMGLIPADEVNPINIYDFEQYPDNELYNIWGPPCFEDPTFTDTRIVTIEDIQSNNGIREPSYKNSQKEFNYAFIYVMPFGESIDEDFLNYINLYDNALPEAWKVVTKDKSIIKNFKDN